MHGFLANHIHRLTIFVVFKYFFSGTELFDFSAIFLRILPSNRKPGGDISVNTRISQAVVEIVWKVPGGGSHNDKINE
jgi:hypothetical protein